MKTVFHLRFGQGVVTEETEESVMVDFNGNHKSLLKKFSGLKDENGHLIYAAPGSKPTHKFNMAAKIAGKKSRGEKRRERDARELAAFNALPPQQQIEKQLMYINGKVYGDRHSTSYKIWIDAISSIEMEAVKTKNDFITDVCSSVERTMKVSPKQAYVLAKFAVENNVTIK